MRYNGTLWYAREVGVTENEYGEAVQTEDVTWSCPIPCSIKTNSDTRKGKYEDGQFRQASFMVLTELIENPFIRVRLERLGEELGEYQTISVTPIPIQNRTQIIV